MEVSQFLWTLVFLAYLLEYAFFRFTRNIEPADAHPQPFFRSYQSLTIRPLMNSPVAPDAPTPGPETTDPAGQKTTLLETASRPINILERVLAASHVILTTSLAAEMFRNFRKDNFEGAGFFVQKLQKFIDEFVATRKGWGHRPWGFFDEFLWLEVYIESRATNTLRDGDDHGPPPPRMRPYLHMLLYHELLRERISISFEIDRCNTTMANCPHPAGSRVPRGSDTAIDLKARRCERRVVVRKIDEFNQILENMALELSVALSKIGKDAVDSKHSTDGSNSENKSILDFLKPAIKSVFPKLELCDLNISQDELAYY